MNEWLTNLIENREKFFDRLCIVIGFLCSALNLAITSNIIVSLISLVILTLFNLFEKDCADIYLERILNSLLGTNKLIIYGVLYTFALLPMIVGCIKGEITFIGLEGFVEKIFSNPLQNCLGAAIVCSIISHLSKFDTQEIIYSVVQERKNFFNIILKFSFMASFLNAINYKIDKNLKITNLLNGIHLFIVVFLGTVLLCIFFLRLVGKRPINLTATQMYPSWVLVFGWAFLASCGLSPIIWGNAKHEVILLVCNTGLALFVICFLFFVIKRKSSVKEKKYQYIAPSVLYQ